MKSWGTPNRLLRAILEDVTDDINVAGIKALGLIDKHVTGPLWRILESGIHIVDVPQYYNKLHQFIRSCTETNVDTFMTGENVPFDRDLIKKDDVWHALVTPSQHDSVAATMLLSIF